MNFKLPALIYIALLLSTGAHCQKYTSSSTGDFVIHGTSSMHDWESDVTAFNIEVDVDFENQNGKVSATIPVESIDSGKSIMDGKTYDALKSDDFPNISFQGDITKITSDKITATGTLKIAGESKKVTLMVPYSRVDGKLEVNGSYNLKMTDYGISPPTALMGTLKTGDDIKLEFNITLTQ